MSVDLQNVDLYTGSREADYGYSKDSSSFEDCFKFGTYKVTKTGPSLLTEKCHLKIQIERNLNNNLYHNGIHIL